MTSNTTNLGASPPLPEGGKSLRIPVAGLMGFFTLKRGAQGRLACLIAFFSWAAYAAYEGIYIREWLSSIHGAPIRVDLLPIGILLAVVSRRAYNGLARRTLPGTATPPSPVGARRAVSGERVCHACGYIGPMKTWLRNYNAPQLLALLLLSLMLLPGIVFIVCYWGKFKCPQCNEVGNNSAA